MRLRRRKNLAKLRFHKSGPKYFFNIDSKCVRNALLHVLSVLPESVCTAVGLKESEMLELYEHCISERALGNLTEAEFVHEKETLTEMYLVFLLEAYSEVEFNSEAWCYKHNRCCPLSPRAHREYRKHFWVDISGSTCVSWSRVGKQAGWLHSSAKVFMTWLFQRRFLQPEVIVHECTPTFPHAIFTRVLNLELESQMKCIWARDTSEPEVGWDVQSMVISPKDIGCPASRERRSAREYSLITFKGLVGVSARAFENFHELFGAPCSCSANIYLAVEMASVSQVGAQVFDFGAPAIGDADRLEAYQALT
eukprot:2377931-Amphidinium_carterae.1